MVYLGQNYGMVQELAYSAQTIADADQRRIITLGYFESAQL